MFGVGGQMDLEDLSRWRSSSAEGWGSVARSCRANSSCGPVQGAGREEGEGKLRKLKIHQKRGVENEIGPSRHQSGSQLMLGLSLLMAECVL